MQVHSSERRKSSAADGPCPSTVVVRMQDVGPDAQAPCGLEKRASSADYDLEGHDVHLGV